MSRYRQRFSLALLAAALTLLLHWLEWAKPFDNAAYDTAVKLFPAEPCDDIVIVAIDEKTLLELGQWPFSRMYHAQLLQQLESMAPAAIGLDILFAERSPSTADDQLLIEQVAASSRVVLPVYIELLEKNNHYLEVLPMAELAVAAPALGHVQVSVDKDGKSRGVYLLHRLDGSEQVHFSVAIEQLINGPLKSLPGFGVRQVSGEFFTFEKSYKNLIPLVGAAGSFPSVSYSDVLHGRLSPQYLQGKTVLVGAVAQGMDPVVTALGPMPGVELNANILNALRNQALIYPLSDLVIFWVNLVIVALWGLCFFSTSVRRNIAAAIAFVFLLNGLSLLLFVGGYWLPFGLATLAVVICFPIMNWWRLSGELKILKKELSRLNKQDIFSAHREPLEDILQSIRFLQSIYPLTAWCVRDSDFQVVAEMATVQVGSEPAEYSQQWRVESTYCLVWFALGDNKFYLALQWQPHLEGASLIQLPLLNKIFPVAQWLSQHRVPQKDIVDESMEALADANQRAEASNRLMLNTLDQSGHGVLLLECSGELLKINRQAKSLLGNIESGDALADRLSTLSLKGQNNWRKLLAELVVEERAFSVEAVTDSGRELQCEGVVFHAGRHFVLLTFTDISELKKEERRRVEAISFLSHDLRSPMSSVLALVGDSKNRNGYSQKLLQNIEQIMERSINYADNFIHLSKVESNAHLNFSLCPISSVIDSAVAQLFNLATSRGVRFQLNYEDDNAVVNCDRIMLERAFLNLVDNAIKYGGGDGVVEIDVCRKGGVVQVDVTDSGDGASEEELASLFDAFRQGDKARTNRVSGAGLGLRLSASVVARHGGEITAANIPGKGLRICVELPLSEKSSER